MDKDQLKKSLAEDTIGTVVPFLATIKLLVIEVAEQLDKSLGPKED